MTTTTQHPSDADFKRILDAIEQGDNQMQAIEKDSTLSREDQLRAATSPYVDFEALRSVVGSRARNLVGGLPPLAFMVNPEAVLGAAWADAFMTGLRFQQMGGTAATPVVDAEVVVESEPKPPEATE